jgi:hypothetical protein
MVAQDQYCLPLSFKVSVDMNGHHHQTPPRSAGSPEEVRIETQIHRRRKAKALSPLEPEWDISQSAPPSQLRMSPSPKRAPDSLEPPQGILDQSVLDEAIGKPKT